MNLRSNRTQQPELGEDERLALSQGFGAFRWIEFVVRMLVLMLCVTITIRASAKINTRDADILRIGLLAEPHSLDPVRLGTYDEGTLGLLIFNSLFDIDTDGKIVPVLAESLPAVSEDGLALDIPAYATIANSIEQDLRKIGVALDLKVVSLATLTDAIMRRKTVPMGVWDWGATIDEPGDTLGYLFKADRLVNEGCPNSAFYSNPEVQELLRAAEKDGDIRQRIQRYQRIEEMIVRDAPWIFVCQRNMEIFQQPWIRGVRLQGIWPPVRLENAWIEK